MPDGAVAARAEQLATLSSIHHEMVTDATVHELVASVPSWIDACSAHERKIVEKFVRDFQRTAKLPADLVEELAHTAAMAQDAWKRSRQSSDFSVFQPLLQRIVELKQREVDIVGFTDHPYDALLDVYEPGMTVKSLTPVFDELKSGTVQLLDDIRPVADRVSDDVLHRHYSSASQLAFATEVVRTLGFDFQRGRVDLSAHPFCTTFDVTDVRLTTRIRENDLRSCLFGLIHEAGHGMYEQGVNASFSGTAAAQGASMGIHESQSLFWENIIARSPEYWSWCYPRLRAAFPGVLDDVTEQEFFKAINRVVRSLNRVESDEVTYNLHIILRFEIERDLISGALSVADIPDAWNAKMESLLGITPPNDAEGCLQDVHWSFGGIGYFPSYTLGKLYSAMEWTAMQVQIPDVGQDVARGEFSRIREWLRENIHDVGSSELPEHIIQRVTGRTLTAADFLANVRHRANLVYGI
jgi:carboxypeptidase Taq